MRGYKDILLECKNHEYFESLIKSQYIMLFINLASQVTEKWSSLMTVKFRCKYINSHGAINEQS